MGEFAAPDDAGTPLSAPPPPSPLADPSASGLIAIVPSRQWLDPLPLTPRLSDVTRGVFGPDSGPIGPAGLRDALNGPFRIPSEWGEPEDVSVPLWDPDDEPNSLRSRAFRHFGDDALLRRLAAGQPPYGPQNPADHAFGDLVNAIAEGPPEPGDVMPLAAGRGAAIGGGAYGMAVGGGDASGGENANPDAVVEPNDELPMLAEPSLPGPAATISRRAASQAVSAVVNDVRRALPDLPRQAAGAVIDYSNNLMHFADAIVRFGEEHGLPNAYVQVFDKNGNWAPRIYTTEEFRTAQAAGETDIFQIPTTGKSDTVTGNLFRSILTFVIARGRLASSGGVLRNIGADVAAGSTGGVDPKEKRLSNLIDEAAPSAITDLLKARPEDEGKIVGWLKSGVETGLTSGLAATATAALLWLKSGLWRPAADEGAASLEQLPNASHSTEPGSSPAPPVAPSQSSARGTALNVTTDPAGPPSSSETITGTDAAAPDPTTGASGTAALKATTPNRIANSQQSASAAPLSGTSSSTPAAAEISPRPLPVPTGADLIAKAKAEGGYVPTQEEADAMSAKLAELQQRRVERAELQGADPVESEQTPSSREGAAADSDETSDETPSQEPAPAAAGQVPWEGIDPPFPDGATFRKEVDNRYTFTIDELERTRRAQGELRLNPTQGRNQGAQKRAGGKDRLPTDHGGHLFGRQFDGSLEDFNHIAQDANFNMGAYKTLENKWKAALIAGKQVQVDIRPHYIGDSLRPDSVEVQYMIDGHVDKIRFGNRKGGLLEP